MANLNDEWAGAEDFLPRLEEVRSALEASCVQHSQELRDSEEEIQAAVGGEPTCEDMNIESFASPPHKELSASESRKRNLGDHLQPCEPVAQTRVDPWVSRVLLVLQTAPDGLTIRDIAEKITSLKPTQPTTTPDAGAPPSEAGYRVRAVRRAVVTSPLFAPVVSSGQSSTVWTIRHNTPVPSAQIECDALRSDTLTTLQHLATAAAPLQLRQLSKRLGIDESAIDAWENGDRYDHSVTLSLRQDISHELQRRCLQQHHRSRRLPSEAWADVAPADVLRGLRDALSKLVNRAPSDPHPQGKEALKQLVDAIKCGLRTDKFEKWCRAPDDKVHAAMTRAIAQWLHTTGNKISSTGKTS